MNTVTRRLAQVRPAVCTVLLQGVATVVAGLFFPAPGPRVVAMVAGVVFASLAVAMLIATYQTPQVYSGEIVPRQPELPPARAARARASLPSRVT
jgi:predicted exporter